MTELETKLLGALKEMTSIVEIHSDATNNNFAWAELDAAHEAIDAAEAAQQVGDIDVVELTNKAYMDGVNDGIEAEREACAMACYTIDVESFGIFPERAIQVANAVATAIRARVNKH